ncbi:MAG TPA: hypothetical protein VIV12_25480 [Streptosporangiaceae bacterium]
MARYKSTARDLGAFICFEDEAGQGLNPPKGRTWARRGARPVVKVRGAGGGRVSIAGVACYRPGDRPHLFYQLRVYRRRKGEAKGFAWQDYRDLIIATHRSLSAPLVWCWDNLKHPPGPGTGGLRCAEHRLAAGLPAARIRAGP